MDQNLSFSDAADKAKAGAGEAPGMAEVGAEGTLMTNVLLVLVALFVVALVAVWAKGYLVKTHHAATVAVWLTGASVCLAGVSISALFYGLSLRPKRPKATMVSRSEHMEILSDGSTRKVTSVSASYDDMDFCYDQSEHTRLGIQKRQMFNYKLSFGAGLIGVLVAVYSMMLGH